MLVCCLLSMVVVVSHVLFRGCFFVVCLLSYWVDLLGCLLLFDVYVLLVVCRLLFVVCLLVVV